MVSVSSYPSWMTWACTRPSLARMTTGMQSQLAVYADALRDLLAVAETVEADEWTEPTACPGGSVREQVAHVLAVERQLSGQPAPPRLETYPPHARSPSGQPIEPRPAAVRDLGPAELVTGSPAPSSCGSRSCSTSNRIHHDRDGHARDRGAARALRADPGARPVDPRAGPAPGRWPSRRDGRGRSAPVARHDGRLPAARRL